MSAILETLGKIGFDWPVALANFVNFLIIFFILKYFVFEPVGRILRKREKKIQEGIENAQKAERDLLMAREKSQEIIEEGRAERNKIVAEGSTEAKNIIAHAERRASKQSEDLITEARTRIKQEEKESLREVTHKSADLIVAGVEEVLKEEIDEKRQQELISKFSS